MHRQKRKLGYGSISDKWAETFFEKVRSLFACPRAHSMSDMT